ncbi:MAG: biopolymer transporter ExbD [Nannocystaceae bacterium]
MDDEGGLDTICEMNVTPMIDVLLSLLIIFMVAAPPPPNEKQPITLPTNPITEQPDNPDATLLLTLDATGKAMLGKTALPDAFEPMVEALRANKKAQQDGRVAISASEAVSYGQVIRVMSAARQAGIASVGLASDRL